MKRVLSSLAMTGCLLTAFPALTWAGGQGFTLFSGVRTENRLPFSLDFNGQANATDRYRLKIPRGKMQLAVAQFAISYPNYYDGSFDTKKVEIRVKGKSLPVSEVKWDKEARVLEIFPEEPVPAGQEVTLVLSNVLNPAFGGMYNFRCLVLSPGDVPILRPLGYWILSIN
ncbi:MULTISPECIES: DUF2808 domain-containing protein [unclassified Anabaena]|uniref:DUF2808 domain-containing protein n=1 Tax=unclassified Anabaena TaxID=2619674 RepID=UPI001447BD2A|nr:MULTISPECIES: DUF2808 domain-containing protein [unclassified Anabaena]MTJ07445.1 DUF2808 domain-containing protein [Anabaena sp. UHCC 0204]MTJ52515.1 DUF2808 domain-containing protein [Anabaena sp. UHCC 0253]